MDLSAVKNILQGLFAKTGVRKRSQLVRLALAGSLGANLGKRSATAAMEPPIVLLVPISQWLGDAAQSLDWSNPAHPLAI